MSVKQELIKYAKACLSFKIPSGQKHRWACNRFLEDLEREKTGEWEYYWDEKEAQNIIDWFALLYHSKGVLAGTPIRLNNWQQFLLCQIFGWREKETGYRRFTKSFIECGRKNSKSQIESGVSLYIMAVEATRYREVYEVYTAGTKRDQSKIVFEEAKLMLNGSPLRSKFDVKRDKVGHYKTGSFMKPLSKEDGRKGDGTNPALLVLDRRACRV